MMRKISIVIAVVLLAVIVGYFANGYLGNETSAERDKAFDKQFAK